MNESAVSQSLAMLQAIERELPKRGDIEEKYIDLYHQSLTEVHKQTGLDLSRFYVPSSELKTKFGNCRIVASGRGPMRYADVAYYDRNRCLMAIRGAIIYFQSLMQPRERTVGFNG